MTQKIEMCCNCDEPTGGAGPGDGSIYICEGGIGPLCPMCLGKIQQEERCGYVEESEATALREEVARLKRDVANFDSGYSALLADITRLSSVAEAAVALCEHTKTLASVPEKQRTAVSPATVMHEWEDERNLLVTNLHREVARYTASLPAPRESGEERAS